MQKVEWLEFNKNREGTIPLIKKWRLSSPKTFKQLKSFMGSIHQLLRYIPKLAQTAAALRPLLKNTEKNKPLDWSPEHSTAFNPMQQKGRRIPVNIQEPVEGE